MEPISDASESKYRPINEGGLVPNSVSARNMMKESVWTPRNTYLYLICLITLMMVIFASVNLVRAVVEVAYPEPPTGDMGVPLGRAVEAPQKVDPDQLEQQRELQRQWSRRRAILAIVGSGVMLLLAGTLYAYHWRRIERGARQGLGEGQGE